MAGIAIRVRQAGLLVVLLTAIGCAATFTNHGYAPSDEELAQLQVGRDTRETVEAAIGRPVSTGVLKDSGWYYTSAKVKHYIYNDDKVIDRQLVAISFGKNGRVSNIERFTLADGKVIALNRRITDTGIKSVGFIRQMLGNLGRPVLPGSATQ